MAMLEILPPPLIPLNTHTASLELVGGKGANLVRLVNAGFRVPNGFLIPTQAYRDFVEQNDLASKLQQALQDLEVESPQALEDASKEIRASFARGNIPPKLVEALRIGLDWLGNQPVAVRSSATAEDLPDLSFAGQQDTFLNVIGLDALFSAVVKCWSSLWTARAIGYRQHNLIPQEHISLSIVVQNMVPSEVSGVAFTANPLTGLRSETVIDATLGLGEALVGGHVEPDHYVVATHAKKIIQTSIGTKAQVISGNPEGGVIYQEVDAANQQALPNEIILQLADLGEKIESLFGFPQDIEWAWAAGEMYVLQSRPITSLFPLPEGMGATPLQLMISFGAIQGFLDPMTPLGQDAIRFLIAGGGKLLGFDLDQETQGGARIAGERLWMNFTAVVRNPMGAKIVPRIFPLVEAGAADTMKQILTDPGLQAGQGRFRLSTIWRAARFAAGMSRRILAFLRKPEQSAEQIPQRIQAWIDDLQAASDTINQQAPTLQDSLNLFRNAMYNGFILGIPEIFTAVLAGLVPLIALNRMSNELTGSGQLALEITRGLPNNVTTSMDLTLWQTAQKIRADTAACEYLLNNPSRELAQEYLQKQLPVIVQSALADFLGKYGMRGVGEFDIGRSRWRENPEPVLQTLQSYLQIEDENMAPDVIFMRSTAQADQAAAQLETAAQSSSGGALKARLIRAAVRRVRSLAGLRESPKFYLIQTMGILRQSLLDRGRELVAAGELNQPDDLFFLYFKELQDFSSGKHSDWQGLVANRRDSYAREKRRRQVPRILLSDGRAFYAGMSVTGTEAGDLQGSPVSPGSVEGKVRVVLNPHQAGLLPGEILVCPGTDPAWTPLFLAAGGLVMEVGGMMTHGAIIAREYGIPAVAGVDRATERLHTGDRIRVDGLTGRIDLLD